MGRLASTESDVIYVNCYECPCSNFPHTQIFGNGCGYDSLTAWLSLPRMTRMYVEGWGGGGSEGACSDYPLGGDSSPHTPEVQYELHASQVAWDYFNFFFYTKSHVCTTRLYTVHTQSLTVQAVVVQAVMFIMVPF